MKTFKTLLMALIGVATMLVSVGVIVVQLGGGAVAKIAPEAAPAALDFSGMRRVETLGVAPDYDAHEIVSAKLRLREGATVASIVGGRAATLDEVPGAVLLNSRFTLPLPDGREGYSTCAATAAVDLGPRHVFTAAHCVLDGKDRYDRFDAWYGSGAGEASKDTMRRIWGHEALVAPDYNVRDGVSGDGDFALVELAQPLDLKPHEMARLATTEEARALTPGTPVIVAGWGSTEGGPMGGVNASPVLKMAVVEIVEAGLLTVSVADDGGLVEGACQGDSGGSLRLASDPRVIIGFLSKTYIEGGGSCVANAYRQVYTAVPYARLAMGAL